MVEHALKLLPVEVWSWEHAERVRQLRNECAGYMTRSTGIITREQQSKWFQSLDRQKNRLFLYDVCGYTGDGISWPEDQAVAYGLCRLIDSKWWVSGGITAVWQNKKLGRQLFAHLVEACNTGGEVWLEVLEANTRGFKTYQHLGFVQIASRDGVITMVRAPEA